MKIFAVCFLFATAGAIAFGAELKTNIEYGQAGGERLLLDVSVPDSPGPHPVAILVHGGGWGRGDKGGSTTPGDNADISPWFGPLTDANFTWFSINYRLAPKNQWPACLDDVGTAIRWVKAHAAEYKGDSQRIALFGHSAGGHLVCLAATMVGDDTRVQAVVGFAAVTDHEQDLAKRGGLSTSLQKLLNRPKDVTPESLGMIREISPNQSCATRPAAVSFWCTATRTPSVPYQQSINFQAKLKAAGVPCELLTVKGAPHSLIEGVKIDPSYREPMIAWLREDARRGSGTPKTWRRDLPVASWRLQEVAAPSDSGYGFELWAGCPHPAESHRRGRGHPAHNLRVKLTRLPAGAPASPARAAGWAWVSRFGISRSVPAPSRSWSGVGHPGS